MAAEMADVPSLAEVSTSQKFLIAVDQWEKALDVAATSLLKAATHINSSGQQIYGDRWDTATTKLTKLSSPTNETTNGSELVVAAMAAASVENRAVVVDTAAEIILNPNVSAQASLKMTRTFSDERSSDLRMAKKDYDQSIVAGRHVLSMASLTGQQLADLWPSAEGLYYEGCAKKFWHGQVVTELFMGVLSCAVNQSESAAAALNSAPDCALGILPDTKEAAKKDALLLSQYHKLQSFGWTIPVGNHDCLPTGLSAVVDLSLPQAQFDVCYDITNLVDRKVVAKLGAIPNIQSGLNYNLVERLKTIKMTPRLADSEPIVDSDPEPIWPANDPLLISLSKEGPARKLVSQKECAYFAGLQPRTLRLAEILGNETVAAIKADSWANPKAESKSNGPFVPTIRRDYTEQVKQLRAKDIPCNTDELVAALVGSLEKTLNGSTLDSAAQLHRIICDNSAAEAGGYVCQAISAVNSANTSRKMRSILMQPLYRTQLSALEREMQLSSLINTVDSAVEIYRTIRPELENLFLNNSALDWHKGFSYIKATTLVLFRRAVERALLAHPPVCNQTSLKLYGLTLAI